MLLDSTLNTVEATLDAMAKRLPAYEDLAGRFGPLLREQALLLEKLVSGGVAVPVIDEARLAAGKSVLAGVDLAPWNEPLAESARRLVPLLVAVLCIDEGAGRALQTYMDDPARIAGLAQARIEGDWKHFENTSVQLGLPSFECLLYLSENVSAPVLRAMVRRLGKPLSGATWDHGYCPVCGSTPSVSMLSAREKTDLDLVGGGGKKYLHCSLCGHDWVFKRNGCPACGNDKNETREIFSVDERKSERIEACHACNSYLLSIDLRECIQPPDPDAVQMGLIHLDIHAQAQSLAPVTRTLWNSLDSQPGGTP